MKKGRGWCTAGGRDRREGVNNGGGGGMGMDGRRGVGRDGVNRGAVQGGGGRV